MKTIWIILLSSLAATGCFGSSLSNDPVANETTRVSASLADELSGLVHIRFDEIVTYHDLELRWLEVMDSRCPTDVTCIRAGEVRVSLAATRIVEQGSKPVEFQLTLQARGKPATASVFGYELTLLSVNPYPKNEVTPQRSSYVAEIKISQAERAE